MVSTGGVVEITIDSQKCRFSMFDPLGCKKCLAECPQAVFAAVPEQEKRDFSLPRDKLQDPEHWILFATWQEVCDGCRVCVDRCPHEALSISINGSPI